MKFSNCETGVSLVMHATLHEDLVQGARNACRICLSVKEGERVLVIADLGSLNIARAFAEVLGEIGAEAIPLVMESLVERPASHAPAKVMELLPTCPVAIYMASPRPGELNSRSEIGRAHV